MAGLFTALIYYRGNSKIENDWRGLGIAVGLMAFLPVAYIVAANIMRGTETVKEAMFAFVIDQKTPPKVLFVFIGVCFVAGVASAVSLLLARP